MKTQVILLGEGLPRLAAISIAAFGVLGALLIARDLGASTGDSSSAGYLRPSDSPPVAGGLDRYDIAGLASPPHSSSRPSASTPPNSGVPPATAAPLAVDGAASTPSCPDLPLFRFKRQGRSPRGVDAARLDELVNWMASHPSATLVIEGHTDPTGTDRFNVLLSFQRAKRVAELFVDRGLDSSALHIEAHGSYRTSSFDSQNSAEQRHVRLRIDARPSCSQDKRP